ncbi:MAG: hypothetical protein ACRDEA_08330 [Microcystaceae cyanobacterium]
MVKFQVPFESLIEAIAALDSEKKRQLLEILEEQLFEAEEDLMEHDPQVLAEVEEARKAYQNGDYQTIQEYVTSRSEQTS